MSSWLATRTGICPAERDTLNCSNVPGLAPDDRAAWCVAPRTAIQRVTFFIAFDPPSVNSRAATCELAVKDGLISVFEEAFRRIEGYSSGESASGWVANNWEPAADASFRGLDEHNSGIDSISEACMPRNVR
jgi:hypothetical protein